MNFSKFFSNLQESPWYREFLNPVIDEIEENNGSLLDIGTGSGKLIQILYEEKNIECTGVDTNSEMLKEAKNKLKNTTITLLKIEANKKLPFKNNSFNYITICNVLFHLDKEGIDFLMKESQRILKDKGKIIVLTPTGSSGILKLTQKYFSFKNLGIYIWYFATKKRSKTWKNNHYLKQYTAQNIITYQTQTPMNGFAQLELLNP